MSGEKKDRGGVVGNNRGRRGRAADRDKNEVSRERQGALLKLRDKDGGATSGSLRQVKDKEDERMRCDITNLHLTLTIKEIGTISYPSLS